MFDRQHPSGLQFSRQHGYSLVELVVSALLIAAIAALSLPTYKDFTAHDVVVDDWIFPVQDGEQAVVALNTTDRDDETQATHQPVAETPEEEEADTETGLKRD